MYLAYIVFLELLDRRVVMVRFDPDQTPHYDILHGVLLVIYLFLQRRPGACVSQPAANPPPFYLEKKMQAVHVAAGGGAVAHARSMWAARSKRLIETALCRALAGMAFACACPARAFGERPGGRARTAFRRR